jgi:cbb3-type cytochrome oxidase subunit 3
METLRTLFTVLSVLTFFGIVFWAYGKPGKRSAESANADLLSDDDRAHLNGRIPQSNESVSL